MGEGMLVDFDGAPIVTGDGIPDEIVTAEVRPIRARGAHPLGRREQPLPVRASRSRVAVKGGAGDCPYTYMHDLAAGRYRVPWEDDVQVKDGTSCGFPHPTRKYAG